MAYNEDQPGAALQTSINDVVQHLQDILPDQEISRAHLLNPTGSWVQSVYFKILLEFGFSDKMLDVHSYSALKTTSIGDHPEIFQQTVPVYKLMAACKYFLTCIEHSERIPFGLMDLTEPDAKRTKRFLATMVNFWQFSNIHFSKVVGVRNHVMTEVSEQGRMHSDIQHLSEKIEKIRMSNAEDSIKEKNVNSQIAEMEGEMAKLAKEMEVEEQVLDKLKAVLNEDKENEERINAAVAELSKREESLKMVLKNVDLNKEMEVQLEQLKDDRDSRVSSEKADLDKKIYGIEEKIKEMKSLIENVENFGNLRKQVKSKSSDRRAQERQIELFKTDVDSLESRILLWKKKNVDQTRAKAAIQNKWKKKIESKEADLRGYRANYQELRKGLSEEEVAAGELRSRVDHAKRDQKKISQEFEKQSLAFEQEYARLLTVTKQKYDDVLIDMEMLQNAGNDL